jgi:rod shape-determining protein MreC
VKQKTRNRKVVIKYVLISMMCFFLIHRAFVKTPGRLEQCLSIVAYPFLKIHNWCTAPFIAVRSSWQNTKLLTEQVETLRIKNEELHGQLVTLESAQQFIADTKELRAFNKRYDASQTHLAHIILKQFDNEHFFLIDAGKQKNITKNMAVVYKNCLVGKITEVYPFYSKVALITDPVCQVASYCSKTKTVGIYRGTRNLDSGALTHVDHLNHLKKGDRVLSSGEGLVFPAGFGIGEIEEFKDTGVHYDVKVKPLIDVTKLAYCYVVQKGEVKNSTTT